MDDPTEDEEREEVEATSIDPLNLAIKAKSLLSRIWWSSVTVALIVALMVAMILLCQTYNKRPISVITIMKPNRLPFPGVTFCNMNAYKRSTLYKMPEVQALLDAFRTAASNSLANSNDNKDRQSIKKKSKRGTKESNSTRLSVLYKSDDKSVYPTNPIFVEQESQINQTALKQKRVKRTGCTCSYSNRLGTAQNSTMSSSKFVAYDSSPRISWACGFTCCAGAPDGANGRLAWITSNALRIYLQKSGVITDYGLWIGMYMAQPQTSYYWYSDSTTQTGTPIDVSAICSGCNLGYYSNSINCNGWNCGGAVTASADDLSSCASGCSSQLNAVLCEFPNALSSATPASTAASAGTTKPATAPSTAGQQQNLVGGPVIAGCACSYSQTYGTAQNSTISPSKFIAYSMDVSWACGFTCCADSPDGTNGRPARITSEDLFWFLKSNSVIDTAALWFGLHRKQSGYYYWYNDSTTQTGSTVPVDSFCSTCMINYYANSDCEGGVAVATNANQLMVCDTGCTVTTGVICEFDGTGSATTASTVASARTTKSVTTQSATPTPPTSKPGTTLSTITNTAASAVTSQATASQILLTTSTMTIQSCGCSYPTPYAQVRDNSSLSTFVSYPNMAISWPCSFTCCANSPVGSNGRPAWITNNQLLTYLQNNRVVNGQGQWLGMHATWTSSESSAYYWYSDPSTPWGSVVPVSSLCSKCSTGYTNYISAGGVFIYNATFNSTSWIGTCSTDCTPPPRGVICEFVSNVTTSTSAATATSQSSTQQPTASSTWIGSSLKTTDLTSTSSSLTGQSTTVQTIPITLSSEPTTLTLQSITPTSQPTLVTTQATALASQPTSLISQSISSGQPTTVITQSIPLTSKSITLSTQSVIMASQPSTQTAQATGLTLQPTSLDIQSTILSPESTTLALQTIIMTSQATMFVTSDALTAMPSTASQPAALTTQLTPPAQQSVTLTSGPPTVASEQPVPLGIQSSAWALQSTELTSLASLLTTESPVLAWQPTTSTSLTPLALQSRPTIATAQPTTLNAQQTMVTLQPATAQSTVLVLQPATLTTRSTILDSRPTTLALLPTTAASQPPSLFLQPTTSDIQQPLASTTFNPEPLSTSAAKSPIPELLTTKAVIPISSDITSTTLPPVTSAFVTSAPVTFPVLTPQGQSTQPTPSLQLISSQALGTPSPSDTISAYLSTMAAMLVSATATNLIENVTATTPSDLNSVVTSTLLSTVQLPMPASAMPSMSSTVLNPTIALTSPEILTPSTLTSQLSRKRRATTKLSVTPTMTQTIPSFQTYALASSSLQSSSTLPISSSESKSLTSVATAIQPTSYRNTETTSSPLPPTANASVPSVPFADQTMSSANEITSGISLESVSTLTGQVDFRSESVSKSDTTISSIDSTGVVVPRATILQSSTQSISTFTLPIDSACSSAKDTEALPIPSSSQIVPAQPMSRSMSTGQVLQSATSNYTTSTQAMVEASTLAEMPSATSAEKLLTPTLSAPVIAPSASPAVFTRTASIQNPFTKVTPVMTSMITSPIVTSMQIPTEVLLTETTLNSQTLKSISETTMQDANALSVSASMSVLAFPNHASVTTTEIPLTSGPNQGEKDVTDKITNQELLSTVTTVKDQEQMLSIDSSNSRYSTKLATLATNSDANTAAFELTTIDNLNQPRFLSSQSATNDADQTPNNAPISFVTNDKNQETSTDLITAPYGISSNINQLSISSLNFVVSSPTANELAIFSNPDQQSTLMTESLEVVSDSAKPAITATGDVSVKEVNQSEISSKTDIVESTKAIEAITNTTAPSRVITNVDPYQPIITVDPIVVPDLTSYVSYSKNQDNKPSTTILPYLAPDPTPDVDSKLTIAQDPLALLPSFPTAATVANFSPVTSINRSNTTTKSDPKDPTDQRSITNAINHESSNASELVGLGSSADPLNADDTSGVTSNSDNVNRSSNFATVKTDNENRSPTIPKYPNVTPEVLEYITNALANITSPTALSTTTEDMMPYLVANLPRSLLAEAGYNLSDLILSCTYDRVPCLSSDFMLKIDPNYGNCYTYNGNGKHMIALQAGMGRGLSLAYYVGAGDYLDFVQASGVRVVIHSQTDTVLPDASGFNLPSGYRSTVAMSQVFMSSINSTCAHSPADVPTFNYLNTDYSTEACHRSCYQKSVLKKCQCGDPRVPLPLSGNFSYCPITKRDCVNAYFNVDIDSTVQCACPPECKVNLYNTAVSMTKWSVIHAKQMRDYRVIGFTGYTEEDGVAAASQIANIDIYFENLIMVEYIETEAYSILDVLWDISSVSGLFLGVSVLSSFEILNLIDFLWGKYGCKA